MKKQFLLLLFLCNMLTTHAQTDWLIDNSPYQAEIMVTDTEIVLQNGLISKTIRITPGVGCTSLRHEVTGVEMLRAVEPEAKIVVNGVEYAIGGLSGQPNRAYLDPRWIKEMKPTEGAFTLVDYAISPIEKRMEWKRVRHAAPDAEWPPKGKHLVMNYAGPAGLSDIRVSIHYNLYDGIPAYSKWMEVTNNSGAVIELDRFVSEILAAVEPESWVESRGVPMPTPNIQVATDYQFGGMTPANVTASSVFWEHDPAYTSQVNYNLATPCLLQVKPVVGPDQLIQPGETFTTFRTWVLVNDSFDRERNSLALRKMYRVIAPWITENPLMMHIRYSDDEAVKLALDQCAEVGFEMAIMTFGSGFNVEDLSAENLAKWKKWADYAHSVGVELGGYSLLSSRRISEEDDVINPETGTRGGVIHGNAPCLGSDWGREYMDKLYRFYSETGMNLLEHDGSYPGHICASTTHPGHRGTEDSQWEQWKIITDYYRWCREQGIYLNVPDWFYLSGSNKNGMGYREVNWSLPREQQVIHTRQNIFDGTKFKTPSMGWMFVPLTEYHGGGAEATIEPLAEHLGHYELMLAGNLGNGVQACYRGPRLYDTVQTKNMVKNWVSFYKQYRDILESDVIHSASRRADGRDLDWIFHANPALETKGFAMVFNPTDRDIQKKIRINLYYSGIRNSVKIKYRWQDGEELTLPLDEHGYVEVPIYVPAGRFAYVVFGEGGILE